MPRSKREVAARKGDSSEEGVDGGIFGGGFRSFLEVLFGSGEIFLHKFIDGEILQGGMEVWIYLESGLELAIGCGEITF